MRAERLRAGSSGRREAKHRVDVPGRLGVVREPREIAAAGWIRERHESFAQEVAEMLAATATSPALERLESVLAKGVALLEEQGALLGPVAGPDMREVPCDEADFSRRFSFQFSPWYLWLHELLAGLLTEAVERGELASLDIPFTADAILATLNPMFYRFQRQERGFSPERILQGLRRIYIDGMKTPNTGNLEFSLRE